MAGYQLHRIHIKLDKTPRKTHLFIGLIIAVPLYLVFIHLNLRTASHSDVIEYFTSASAAVFQPTSITAPSPSVHYLKGGVAPHDFTYIIKNERLCDSAQDLTYFMYVLSAPSNFENRMNIRKTWGNVSIFKQHTVRLAFMLANPADTNLQQQIYRENEQFGDIVQQNFVDSYQNVTLKGIMCLEWISKYCQNAPLVLKFDDDVIVNVVSLMEFVQKHAKFAKRTFYCKVDIDYRVERDPNHRYYVPEDQYPLPVAPPRCIGPGWIVTSDLIKPLYNASSTAPFIVIEDIYTSGILALMVGNVTHAYWHAFSNVYDLAFNRMMAIHRFSDETRQMPVVAVVPKDAYFEIWEIIISRLKSKERKELNLDSKFINSADSSQFKKLAIGLMR